MLSCSSFLKKYSLNLLFFILSIIYCLCIRTYHNEIFVQFFPVTLTVLEYVSYIIVIVVSQILSQLIKGVYFGNKFATDFCKVFLIYAVIMLLLCYLSGGGIYNGDEVVVANDALMGNLNTGTAHYLTAIFFTVSYFIFALPCAPTIAQCLTVSAIFAYIYAGFSSFYNFKLKFLPFLPMFFPAVLRMNLQPLRSNIYYPFLLLFFALVFFMRKKEKNVSYVEIILLSIFSAILSVWRTENTIFLVMFPIMLKYLFGELISLKKIVIYFFVFLTLFVSSVKYTEAYAFDYKLISMARPLSAILKTDFRSNDKEHDLEIISKVINIDDYKNTEQGMTIFLNSFADEFSQETLNKLIPVYIKLSILNIDTYLKDRKEMLEEWKSSYFLRDSVFFYQNNNDRNEKTINILELRKNNYELGILSKAAYNVLIPVILLIIAMIYGLIKKIKPVIAISITSLLLTLIVFMTCAEQYFHYYVQSYVAGYFFLFLYITVAAEKKVS